MRQNGALQRLSVMRPDTKPCLLLFFLGSGARLRKVCISCPLGGNCFDKAMLKLLVYRDQILTTSYY